MEVSYFPAPLTRKDIIQSLVETLKQASFEPDGSLETIFVTDAIDTKSGIRVECTDGSIIALEVKQLN